MQFNVEMSNEVIENSLPILGDCASHLPPPSSTNWEIRVWLTNLVDHIIK